MPAGCVVGAFAGGVDRFLSGRTIEGVRRTLSVKIDQSLYERAKAQLPPETSLSRLLEERLRAELGEMEGCQHEVLRCARCGVRIEQTAAPEAAAS